MDECNTTEHQTKYTQTLQRIMYFGEAKYFKLTGCMAQCNYYYYSTKQVYLSFIWFIFWTILIIIYYTSRLFSNERK